MEMLRDLYNENADEKIIVMYILKNVVTDINTSHEQKINKLINFTDMTNEILQTISDEKPLTKKIISLVKNIVENETKEQGFNALVNHCKLLDVGDDNEYNAFSTMFCRLVWENHFAGNAISSPQMETDESDPFIMFVNGVKNGPGMLLSDEDMNAIEQAFIETMKK